MKTQKFKKAPANYPNAFIVETKRFDQDTGVELEPLEERIDLSDLESQLESVEAQASNLKKLIKQVKVL